MINKLRQIYADRFTERADVVQTVILIPIVIFLLFTMVNLSSYFAARGDINSAARNGARLVAMYGGNSAQAIKNNTGKSVERTVMDYIYDPATGRCTMSFCSEVPIVDCTPEITRDAGEPVSCTISYRFSPIAPFPDYLEALNFGTGAPISVTSTFVAETGVR